VLNFIEKTVNGYTFFIKSILEREKYFRQRKYRQDQRNYSECRVEHIIDENIYEKYGENGFEERARVVLQGVLNE
jgi:hypothetical protein